jgi:hypothetical protein
VLAPGRITGMDNPGCFSVRFPELHSTEWLQEHYVVRGESCRAIAAALGCSIPHVSVSLKQAGLPARPHTACRIDAKGRECARCGNYQLWGEFYKSHRMSPGGRMPTCKMCEKSRPRYTARTNQLAKFGITPDDFAWLFKQQGGVCALCFRAESRSDPRRSETVWTLAVDHDHAHCGKGRACKECIRGLLCASCNTLLGRVEESGEPLVLRFTDYLGSRPFVREEVMPNVPLSVECSTA